MDLSAVATPTGFMGWFAEYGQVVYIFMQMAFWVLIGIAGAIAAAKYSQYVDFVTGKTASKREAKAGTTGAESAAFADSLEADE